MFIVKMATEYVVRKLGETTTWNSLWGAGLAELHIHTNAELNTAVVHVGVSIGLLIGVLVNDGWRVKA